MIQLIEYIAAERDRNLSLSYTFPSGCRLIMLWAKLEVGLVRTHTAALELWLP